MLTGDLCSARCQAFASDQLTVNLLSRLAGEGGFSAGVNWTAQAHPASAEDILIGGGVIGERWKVFEMFLAAQTSVPHELDRISDATSTWTVKNVDRRQNGNVFWCRCLYASTP